MGSSSHVAYQSAKQCIVGQDICRNEFKGSRAGSGLFRSGNEYVCLLKHSVQPRVWLLHFLFPGQQLGFPIL